MFKVERIVLKGFAGLGLHDIKEFDFTIKKKMMIILGGNGCGKSSFLDVYFPLAPAKADFRVGGSYVNYCEKDEVRYRCTVKRSETNLHCSIKNLTAGEYICKDVNPKVYNAHIEDITGLNKDVVDLINGRTRLTKANTTVRKAWFTMLSTTDLTYGLKFYKDMRTHHRDLGAVADHLARKIAEIRLKTVESKEERDAIKARLDEMELMLQAYSSPEIRELEAYRERSTAPLNYLNETRGGAMVATATAVVLIPKELDLSETGLEDLTHAVEHHQQRVGRIEGEIGQRNQRLAEHENALQRQSYLMRNHESLRGELERATAEMVKSTACVGQHRYTFLLGLTRDQLDHTLRDFPGVTKELNRHLDRISGKYRIAEAESKTEAMSIEVAQLHVGIEHRKLRIQEIEHDLSHFDQTEDVECPNCQHVFKPGVLRSREELQQAYAQIRLQLESAETQYEKLQADIGPMLAEVDAMRSLRNLMLSHSNHPAFGGLFKVLYSEEALTVNRARLHLFLDQFESELGENILHAQNLTRQGKLEKEWEDAVRSVGELDPKLLAKVEEERAALEEVAGRLVNAKAAADVCNKELQAAMRCKTHVDEFMRVQDQVRQAIESTFVESLWGVLMRNKERLLDTYSVCRTRWAAMEAEIRQLNEFEKEHAETLERRQHVGQMVQAWSPEKGVLQKYYFNAISRITMLMTAHVRQCWTYDMKVLPCSVDGGELNYQFPYQLKDKPEPISDISKSSTGQAEIFDLVFRLVSYAALGLTEYPLLLDEPATGFDENHRALLVNFIKRVTDGGMFSQLLVVSHLSDVHSKLNEAEYCVIEPEGVTLPERYNEAIRIVYEGDSED